MAFCEWCKFFELSEFSRTKFRAFKMPWGRAFAFDNSVRGFDKSGFDENVRGKFFALKFAKMPQHRALMVLKKFFERLARDILPTLNFC